MNFEDLPTEKIYKYMPLVVLHTSFFLDLMVSSLVAIGKAIQMMWLTLSTAVMLQKITGIKFLAFAISFLCCGFLRLTVNCGGQSFIVRKDY